MDMVILSEKISFNKNKKLRKENNDVQTFMPLWGAPMHENLLYY